MQSATAADTTAVRELLTKMLDRHEKVLTPADLEAVTNAARDSGLLAGFWAPEQSNLSFTVGGLRAVAGMNGGVAFHLHRFALAEWLSKRLGRDGTAMTAVSLLGHYGLARQALPRLIGGRVLDDADKALLDDYFDLTGHSRVVIGGEWESLIAAGFDGTDITWHVVQRANCASEVQPNSHGFNELETTTVRLSAPGTPAAVNTDLLVEALYRDHLGLAAIAAGVVDRSLMLARGYARERRQGGSTIEDYPAVRQLLGQMSAVTRSATHNLSWFSAQTPSADTFADLCAWRQEFHARCCTAANNGMQVLGGRGYMKDFGLERLVRDSNTLRIIGGTPNELAMFVAEWERAQ